MSPQVVNGIYIACPGASGSVPILFLVDAGPPTSSTDPDVASCSIGSLYRDYQNGHLYFKGASGAWRQAV
jgi:hypothetical protein